MSPRFESAGLLWWITISISMLYLILLTHWPSVLPFDYLGLLGEFSQYLVSNHRLLLVIIAWAAIVAHIYEAQLARDICRQLKIDQTSTRLWVIQTFIMGYPSLRILKRYALENKQRVK